MNGYYGIAFAVAGLVMVWGAGAIWSMSRRVFGLEYWLDLAGVVSCVLMAGVCYFLVVMVWSWIAVVVSLILAVIIALIVVIKRRMQANY